MQNNCINKLDENFEPYTADILKFVMWIENTAKTKTNIVDKEK
jgi:hypothetical protein